MAASFFDDDDEVNLASGQAAGKSKLLRKDGRSKKLDAPAVVTPPPATASLTDQRFRITEQDALAAEKHRRLAGSSSLKGTAVESTRSTHIQDALVASMEAAQRKREAEREMALVAKLRAEREADSNVPELVEKDLEVGVFVTDAYRKKLRATVATINGDVLEDNAPHGSDDDGLFHTPHSTVSSIGQGRAKYYDTVMSMGTTASTSKASPSLASSVDVSTNAATARGSGGDVLSIPLVGSGAASGAVEVAAQPPPLPEASAPLSVQEAKGEALQRLELAKRAARRARAAFVVDEQMLAAARQRFFARQAATLEQHAKFLR